MNKEVLVALMDAHRQSGSLAFAKIITLAHL